MSQPGTPTAAFAGLGLEAFKASIAHLPRQERRERRELTLRALAPLLRMDGDELVATVLIDDEAGAEHG